MAEPDKSKREKRLFLLDGKGRLEFEVYFSVDEPNGDMSVLFQRVGHIASVYGLESGGKTAVYLRLPLDEHIYESRLGEVESGNNSRVQTYVLALDYARTAAEKIGKDLVDLTVF